MLKVADATREELQAFLDGSEGEIQNQIYRDEEHLLAKRKLDVLAHQVALNQITDARYEHTRTSHPQTRGLTHVFCLQCAEFDRLQESHRRWLPEPEEITMVVNSNRSGQRNTGMDVPLVTVSSRDLKPGDVVRYASPGFNGEIVYTVERKTL